MFFLKQGKSAFLYISKASVFTITTSFSLLVLVYYLIDFPDSGPSVTISYVDFFGFVILTPLIETALMILSLNIFCFVSGNFVVSSVLNSLLWSALHSTIFLLWGVFTIIPFFVFSIGYLIWKDSSSVPAFVVPFVIHLALNFFVFLVVWSEDFVFYF